jgi:hypothetical protein
MSPLAALPLPATDLDALRERVRRLAENRPAVYRMATLPAARSTSGRPSGSAPAC